ncbi:hypothetical protein LF63_0108480 [Oleiagrimonas soli]|uniref:ADP-ribosyl-(Dinitrogen reductase) hydrolase n=1 Tax=Oleiagrimonas soli TaxID=1543381 RepID=A0A099CXX5_9GAMM|nr:hypothetical protein LF63_0108480 [Oleiagrimonas soli]
MKISKATLDKLKSKHDLTEKDVFEAIANRSGHLLRDTREKHRTDPPTMWFVAYTNHRRLIKVCVMQRDDGIHVKTAYDANETEIIIYRVHGKPTDF